MTDDAIKQLARECAQGSVFTSFQIPLEQRQEYVPQVFALILLMDEDQYARLKAAKPVMFYGYMRDACPMGINGYPCLMSLGHLNVDEATKFVSYMRQIQTAMESL